MQSLESLSKNLSLSSKKKGTKCDFQNELYTFDTKSLAFFNNNFDSRVKVALTEDMKRQDLNASPIVKSLELCLSMLGNQIAKAEEDTKGMQQNTPKICEHINEHLRTSKKICEHLRKSQKNKDKSRKSRQIATKRKKSRKS